MKQSIIIVLVSLLLVSANSFSQGTDGVLIDPNNATTRDASAVFQAQSTSQGMLVPRMNAAQRGLIPVSAARVGLLVYQTDGTAGFYYYNGTAWVLISSSSGSGFIENRAVDNAFGTGQAASYDVTGNAEIGGTMKVSGNMGVGIISPLGKLDVQGTVARTGTHATSPSFYVTGTLTPGQTGPAAGNIEFRHDNGTQGIGFGYNTIYQAGSNTNQDLNLLSKGSSHLTLNAFAYSTGNVGIGLTGPSEKLEVNGAIKMPGASATDNNSPALTLVSDDDFLYDAEYINHYAFGFHNFNDGAGSGANSYMSGYYGVDLFTGGAQRFRINNNGTVKINNLAGTGSRVVVADASGNLSATTSIGSGIVSGSGAQNYVTKWNNAAGTTIGNSQIFDDGTSVGIGSAVPGGKLDVNGGALTLSNAYLDINRDAYVRNGISWYAQSYPSWSTYMSPGGTAATGPHGDLTAPAGTYVTSWALRNYIENAGGYGWTFESAANTTTPAVKFEIRASDGLFHSYGDGYVDGVVYAGAYARMGTNISAGYYQDVTNGAYRSIVSSGTDNGYYFQTNGGATTTMWVGLGGPYNGRVGIGTTTPAASLHVPGTGSTPLFQLSSVTMSSVSGGDLVLRNLGQLRFSDGNAWDWNSWGGIKYVTSSNTMYIGGPASAQFTANSSPPSIAVVFDGVSTIRPTYMAGSGTRFVVADASGNLSATTGTSSGIVTGSGNTNYIPKWTPNGSTLGNSLMSDDGTTVVNAGQLDVTGGSGSNYITAPIEIKTTAIAPRLSFHWSGVVASQISIESGGRISILDNPGTGYENLIARDVYASRDMYATNEIYLNNWVRHSDNDGTYWSNNGWHIYPNDASDMILRTGSGNGGIKGTIGDATARGYIHWTTSNEIGFLNASRGWSLRVDNAGNTFATTSSRAPIFYDNDNTGYYTDPASTSNLNNLRFNTADCINGTCPPNNAIRMTPNFHLNSGAGNAVILNWDNGTTGGSQTLRIGNGAGGDVFTVQANGWTSIGGAGPEQMLDVRGYAQLTTGGSDVAYMARGGNNWRHHLIGLYPGWSTLATYLSGYNYYNSGPDFTQVVYVGGGSNPLPLRAQNYANWSSAKFKENISALSYTNASEVIAHLVPREYDLITGNKHTLGFIVEELLPHIPEAISFGENGKAEALDYAVLTTVLVKAFQEQNAKLQSLEKSRNILSSGVNSIAAGSVKFIPFDASFISDLNGSKPVVTVSALGNDAQINIKEIKADGFSVAVKNTELNSADFTWIAVGPANQPQGVDVVKGYTPKMSYSEAASRIMSEEEIEKFRNETREIIAKSMQEKAAALQKQ